MVYLNYLKQYFVFGFDQFKRNKKTDPVHLSYESRTNKHC
jgi:hypothetical protein